MNPQVPRPLPSCSGTRQKQYLCTSSEAYGMAIGKPGREASPDLAATDRGRPPAPGQPAAAYCSRKNASSASAARLSTRVLERTM